MIRRIIRILLMLLVVFLAVAAGGWAWLWHTETGASWAWQQARDAVAGKRGATLEGTVSGTLGRGVSLTNIRYHDEKLSAAASRANLRVSLRTSPVSLIVPQLNLADVELVLEVGEPQADPAAQQWPDNLALPFPINVRKLHVDRAVIRRADTNFEIHSIDAKATWHRRVTLEIASLEAPDLSGALELEALMRAPYPLEAEVSVSRYQLPPQAMEGAPWLPESMSASLRANGDLDALAVEGQLRWADFIPEATLKGEILQPVSGFQWTLTGEVPEMRFPREWLPDNESAGGPEDRDSLALQDLTVNASGADLHLEFEGSGMAVSPWTRNARVRLGGKLDEQGLQHWTFDGSADLGAPGWPEAAIDFAGSGGAGEIRFNASAPQLFGGALSASAVAPREPEDQWQGEISAQGVAVKPLLEALETLAGDAGEAEFSQVADILQSDRIDAQARLSLGLDPLYLDADILQFEGQVRGRAVTASGRMIYGDEVLRAEALRLRSGSSRAVVDGPLYGPPGLKVELDIATLDDFLPGATGSLAGSLRYRHDPDRGFTGSRLRANLQGSDIRARGWQIESLRVTEPESPASGAPLAVVLKARGVTGRGLTIDQLNATLEGDLEHQEIGLDVRLPDAGVAARIKGGLSGTANEGWRGTLDDFTFDPYEHPAWRLSEPAVLRLSQRFELRSACLTPDGEAALCVDIEQMPDGVLAGHIEASSAPLDLLAHIAGLPFSFSQRLDGTLGWVLPPDARPSASAEFDVSEGIVRDRIDDLELLNTLPGSFSFQVDRGRLHSGQLDIPLETGFVDVDFEVPDILAGPDTGLQGRIITSLDDLDALTIFVPQLVQTDGELRSVLLVEGTAQDPRLSGVIELLNGRTTVLASGMRIREARLTGRLDDQNHLRVNGTFRAGQGLGEIRADVDATDPLQPTMEMSLKGDALTLIDVPELVVRANTDLSARWDAEALRLSGTIHVPSARFAPRFQPNANATESPDVVIVAGAPEQSQNAVRQNRLLIQGELEVSLGDDVRVDLDVAEASLTGRANFKWAGPPVPLANGGYDLEGEIQAYGQTLEITRASVRFPDVPANNPHLDVRAERRIYGNPQISHAGVRVHGTLKRPITEPYTVPATNADRARALLITGSDFNYEQGTGAVSVGTYISPKLYLAYGVGLFEEGNVITVRYDLKRNFGVKATSGQDDTGIDFSYTIER